MGAACCGAAHLLSQGEPLLLGAHRGEEETPQSSRKALPHATEDSPQEDC